MAAACREYQEGLAVQRAAAADKPSGTRLSAGAAAVDAPPHLVVAG